MCDNKHTTLSMRRLKSHSVGSQSSSCVQLYPFHSRLEPTVALTGLVLSCPLLSNIASIIRRSTP